MPRVNVYLPDDLAERAREAGLNVSALTQSAIEAELARTATRAWIERVGARKGTASHEAVLDALDAGREELGDVLDQ